MKQVTDVTKEIILNIDEKCNYASIICKKINRNQSQTFKLIRNLIENEIIECVFINEKKKYLRLTEKGIKAKELLLQLKRGSFDIVESSINNI